MVQGRRTGVERVDLVEETSTLSHPTLRWAEKVLRRDSELVKKEIA
jgi:hypothetical protein